MNLENINNNNKQNPYNKSLPLIYMAAGTAYCPVRTNVRAVLDTPNPVKTINMSYEKNVLVALEKCVYRCFDIDCVEGDNFLSRLFEIGTLELSLR